MAIIPRKYGYKRSPQVSATQMAEYLTASPTRRKTIIRDAKFPSTSIVALYSKAREGIAAFLGDEQRSLNHLAEATEYLRRRGTRTDVSQWIVRDNRSSTEAIEAFQSAYGNRLRLNRLDCRPVQGRSPSLDLWPTRISVALDVTVHRTVLNGRDEVGGIMLLFSKGEASSSKRIDRCKTIAGLVHTYCQRFLSETADPSPALCLAIDVINRTAYPMPGTFARKLVHISDACDEIADRWQRAEPPNDYDGPEPD